jgi:hypothetical protein
MKENLNAVETDHYICGCMQIYDFDDSKAHWKWVLCREHTLIVRHAIKDAEQDERIRIIIARLTNTVIRLIQTVKLHVRRLVIS